MGGAYDPCMSREQLTAIDTAWLRMDQPTNPMMITAVILFRGKVDAAGIEALLERQILPLRRFSLRVADGHVPGVLPHWEPDPHFHLRNHVHAIGLPAPRDRAALETLVSDLMSQTLDRARPLWQVHLVDGMRLEDGAEASALVVRLHHCIGDGVALVSVLMSLTDEGNEKKPHVPAQPGHAAHGALAMAKEAAAQTAALGRMLLLSSDPETAYRGPLGVQKRVAFSRAIALEEVRAIASSISGKINDVLMAACAGAMRADLLARGWDGAREVRALVPVHLTGGRAADGLGNHIGLVFVDLPITEADPKKRLLETKARMDRVKEQPDASVALGVLAAMGVASHEIEHIGVQLFAKKASALITNVPGPTGPVHLAGNPVESLMVWAPVSGGIGLGFTLLSYAGSVRLGVASDTLRVPDPARLTAAFEAELETLAALAR